jgi:thymidine kinase
MHNNNVHLLKISNIIPLITAFVGAMFAEKTSYLFSCLNRHARGGQKVILFRPKKDKRYKKPKTHDGVRLLITKFKGEIIRVSKIQRILDLALKKKVKVVGIDEAQFFSSDLIKILVKLYEHGIIVYLSALDTDYRAINFITTSNITKNPLVSAVKMAAICDICKSDDGVYSLRYDVKGNLVTEDSKRVRIGGKRRYKAACHACRKKEIIKRNKEMLKRKKKK